MDIGYKLINKYIIFFKKVKVYEFGTPYGPGYRAGK